MPAAPIVGSLEPVASQVTTQEAKTTVTPQAQEPAGTPQAETQPPAGQNEQEGSETEATQETDEQPKSWKEKRQERNRQRWQEYKQAKEVLPHRLASLEAEVARLRGARPPDFSQITDPNEELAERTAWKVRQSQAEESEARLQAEREVAFQEQNRKMYDAWGEAVDEARQRIPDFDKALDPASNKVHVRMMPFLVETEKAADIVYWLHKNPSEADKLFDEFERKSPQALMSLGRIEARLSAPQPKTLSTAPKPAPVLSGGANPLQFNAERASVDDMATQLRKAGIIR